MKTILALSLLTAAAPAHAQQPLLSPMFQDHAVLQRGQPINVFGKSAPGEEVTVMLAGSSARGKADASGQWRAQLPAQQSGGPYTLTAESSSGKEQGVSDVLVGDVWLCSGQSNMVLQVKRALDSRAEIANSANQRIRMLTVPLASSALPVDTFAQAVTWEVAGPNTVPDWSATCFYFVRELQKTVDVPMGMVNASWGGSNIQTWMSDAALRGISGYAEHLDLMRLYASDRSAAVARWGELWQRWWQTRAPGGGQPWSSAGTSAAQWRAAPADLGFWESWGVPELANFNGMLWYRTSFALTPAKAAQDATLSLGPIDEVDATWVNGVMVGTTSGAGTDRTYKVPAALLRAGNNVVVVNALDTYATGGMYGLSGSRALRFADGASVPLGNWQYQVVPPKFGTPPRTPWDPTGGVTAIHNAMITPIGPYNFRAVVWYQGESNTGAANAYQQLLAAWMADWRSKYGADLRFLIVQLAGYGPAPAKPVESGWAGVREAQRLAVLADQHAGLATAVDLGDRYDIHPANKQELGRRLARAARHVVYGEAIPPSGPQPVSATHAGNDVVVKFRDVTGELVAYSAVGPIGFELCGADQPSCRYATARIETDGVHLAVPIDAAPTRVRFCWADSPVCTLYDRAALPALPFELPIKP